MADSKPLAQAGKAGLAMVGSAITGALTSPAVLLGGALSIGVAYVPKIGRKLSLPLRLIPLGLGVLYAVGKEMKAEGSDNSRAHGG